MEATPTNPSAMGASSSGLPIDLIGSGSPGADVQTSWLALAKKKKLEKPCASCGEPNYVVLMFQSSRDQHRVWISDTPLAASDAQQARSGERLEEDTPTDVRDSSSAGWWQYTKICVGCEVSLRNREGAERSSELEVKEDVIFKFKGTGNQQKHMGKLTSYVEAVREVKDDVLTKKARREQVSKLAKEKFNKFLDTFFKDEEMFDMVLTAGKGIEEVGEIGLQLEKLEAEIQAEQNLIQKEKLIDAHNALNVQAEEECVYDSFVHLDNQFEMLDALDNDDRITKRFRRYYVCKRTRWTKEKGVWTSTCCGCYFPSSLWYREPSNKRYKCRVDWDKALKHGKEARIRAVMEPKHGADVSKWPVLGCGECFYAFKHGMSSVIEYQAVDGSIETFMSDLFPAKLQNVLQKKKVQWMKAAQFTTREEVLNAVDMVFPRENIIDGIAFLSRFPVDDYVAKGGLQVTQKAWCKFCIMVAQKDEENLYDVLACAQSELQIIELKEAKL